MSNLESFFVAADRDAIAAAVAAAERETGGEIVPFAVAASDGYEVAAWKGATLGALLGVLAAAVVHRVAALWGTSELWLLAPAIVGAALGFVLGQFAAPVRRWLVGREVLEREVQQRAQEAFLSQEIFRTRDRTGILIFVSLFERQVTVLADSGIHAAVEAGAWRDLVDELAAGIRRGEAGPAMVRAVERCGALLRTHQVERRAEDVNELPDQLHFSDR